LTMRRTRAELSEPPTTKSQKSQRARVWLLRAEIQLAIDVELS
jgi:hypothetical protein